MADDISTHLAANMKRLREALGLSQQALADASGVPRPTVAHLESGSANPTLGVVSRVARALGVSLDGLVEGSRSEVRVLAPGELRTERRGKTRRTSLLPEGVGRDLVFERIAFREGGHCELGSTRGTVDLIACASGRLVLRGSHGEVELHADRVAVVRGDVEVAGDDASVAYRVAGLAFG